MKQSVTTTKKGLGALCPEADNGNRSALGLLLTAPSYLSARKSHLSFLFVQCWGWSETGAYHGAHPKPILSCLPSVLEEEESGSRPRRTYVEAFHVRPWAGLRGDCLRFVKLQVFGVTGKEGRRPQIRIILCCCHTRISHSTVLQHSQGQAEGS